MSTSLQPLRLGKEGETGLFIEWNDGHRSVYTWKNLREQCPCASCREEKLKAEDPFRILTPEELKPKPPLAAVEITPVGYYAYKITWNDGHDTGIYTLENLRAMCECPECRSSATQNQQTSSA
ncbi:MAG: hypothetical protein KatS3mg105_1430 [Gemmatales bacterium]|nr:MAG: hypothetical protein KatS3mg105_1430 [Gemmatales bacterium]